MRFPYILVQVLGGAQSPESDCLSSELPDDVLISIPDVMLEGVDYQWTCHIINGPPAQNLKLRWHDGLQDVETRVFNQTATAPVNVSSSITFTAKREHDGRRFECVAEVDLGLYHTEPNPASLGFKQAVVYCEFSSLVRYGGVFFQADTRAHSDFVLG